MQDLRRGHYEHGTDLPIQDRLRTAFTDLTLCYNRDHQHDRTAALPPTDQRNSAPLGDAADTVLLSANDIQRAARQLLS